MQPVAGRKRGVDLRCESAQETNEEENHRGPQVIPQSSRRLDQAQDAGLDETENVRFAPGYHFPQNISFIRGTLPPRESVLTVPQTTLQTLPPSNGALGPPNRNLILPPC